MSKPDPNLERLLELKSLIDIQCADGNWDDSPYMFGFANGMLLAYAVLTDTNPEYRDKPKTFREDIKILDKFNKSSIIVRNETD